MLHVLLKLYWPRHDKHHLLRAKGLRHKFLWSVSHVITWSCDSHLLCIYPPQHSTIQFVRWMSNGGNMPWSFVEVHFVMLTFPPFTTEWQLEQAGCVKIWNNTSDVDKHWLTQYILFFIWVCYLQFGMFPIEFIFIFVIFPQSAYVLTMFHQGHPLWMNHLQSANGSSHKLCQWLHFGEFYQCSN